MERKRKKLSLTAQIGIALLLAVVAGVLLRNQAAFVNAYIKPIGIIFLNLLKFIVVPLVLFSIMAGILSMNDIKKVGKLGLRTLLYFMGTTLFAVTLGLVIPSLLKGILPTIHIDLDAAAETVEVPRLSVMDQLVNMFPSNIVAVQFVGMPEGRIPLAEAVTYVASAPKSNAAYLAVDAALADVRRHDCGRVPSHLRDAHYKGAAKLGHGEGYKYAHDFPGHFVRQQYLPTEMKGVSYYHPTDNGREKHLRDYLKWCWPERFK